MRKAVVTWVCDQCKTESEPLKPGVTFNWSYEAPRGWCIYKPPQGQQCSACGRWHEWRAVGLGNDPLLKSDGTRHFCSQACKDAWLAIHVPDHKPTQPPFTHIKIVSKGE